MDQELSSGEMQRVVNAMTPGQREWLAQQFDSLTSELDILTPSEWAEQKRYLPPSVTPFPGYYSFDVAPYVREIVDCMSVDSPIREVSWMKGVQICATTGGLENTIGYYIDHVKTSPMMLVTADADMAQLRMTSYITPMLQHSDLMHLIKSGDEKNARKTGKTDKKLEWLGGGFLVLFGAQNANKLRSIPIQILLNDEIDGWPDTVGKQGDPVKLVRDRTAAYETSRKIFDVSTPLIKGSSKIEALFERGDQRYYFVRCLRCEHPQILRWRRENKDTGEVTGIVWEMDGNLVVPDSTRYLCEHCGHPHSDADKTALFAPGNAEWRPTSDPVAADIRSYHLSALYSPPGMQSWGACVQKWVEAWDIEKSRPRDLGKLQVFYNNVLGESFELRGEKLRFENVSAHRRAYKYGEIPNKFAAEFCGGPVMILTCAVDVHKDNLKVGIFGWCKERRTFLIDRHTLEGVTEQLEDPGTWGALDKILQHRTYTADDGKQYRIEITLIDSGYNTDVVYRYCAKYERGVFAVKGMTVSPKSARVAEFSSFQTRHGIMAYGITVDLYKDRWSASLRKSWDGMSQQPHAHFNAPIDISDKVLKELTAEVKREKIEKATGKRVGFEWHRPSGSANELWDLLIYNNAALDLIAWDLSQLSELDFTNWPAFWDACEHQHLYFKLPGEAMT